MTRVAGILMVLLLSSCIPLGGCDPTRNYGRGVEYPPVTDTRTLGKIIAESYLMEQRLRVN
jgi:hypothetical protein